jgi:hypothetical protein
LKFAPEIIENLHASLLNDKSGILLQNSNNLNKIIKSLQVVSGRYRNFCESCEGKDIDFYCELLTSARRAINAEDSLIHLSKIAKMSSKLIHAEIPAEKLESGLSKMAQTAAKIEKGGSQAEMASDMKNLLERISPEILDVSDVSDVPDGPIGI